MITLFVAARALHYASAMLVFGELVGLLGIAGLAWRHATLRGSDGLSRRFFSVARWSIAVGLASGAVWLAVETAVMSGMPVAQAMNRDTLGLVLGDTAFGRLWLARAGLLVALGAALLAMRRASGDARRAQLAIVAALLAAAYLGTLAGAGHAAAGQPSDDDLQLVADVVHLLAAGAWLGALPMLAFLLREANPQDAAAQAAQRFSTLGLACVAALVASGVVNASYQVGDVPALVGTGYGRLLLAKLGLFAALLALAIANRGVLTPRMTAGEHGARGSLQRNVGLEVALGIGILTLVGKLGVTEPAVHQSPLWPFSHTLSWQAMQESAWAQLGLTGAGAVALIAASAVLAGVLRRPPRVGIAALVGLVIPAAAFAWLLVVPAHPTTYVVSPVRYTAAAVASGSRLYAANCSACHGRDGRGDAPEGRSSAIALKDLSDIVPDRREGDLYWSIAHGIPGTAMPGFVLPLSDAGIWRLIQFLDAQAAARNAGAMTDRLRPLRPIPAPDFTYEFSGRAQESLREPAGKRVTLLAFYALPQSASRLGELALRQREYAAAGARVIAVPMGARASATVAPSGGPYASTGAPVSSSGVSDASTAGTDASRGASIAVPGRMSATGLDGAGAILASVGDEVATAYAMFAPPGAFGGEGAPAHVEYLIDRDGYLRVRWLGVPASPAERTAALLKQIDVLYHEPPRAPAQWGHRH